MWLVPRATRAAIRVQTLVPEGPKDRRYPPRHRLCSSIGPVVVRGDVAAVPLEVEIEAVSLYPEMIDDHLVPRPVVARYTTCHRRSGVERCAGCDVDVSCHLEPLSAAWLVDETDVPVLDEEHLLDARGVLAVWAAAHPARNDAGQHIALLGSRIVVHVYANPPRGSLLILIPVTDHHNPTTGEVRRPIVTLGN